MKNIFIGVGVIAAVLGVLAFFNLTPFRSVIVETFGSPVGTTFTQKKIADITFSMANSTSTSILNPIGQLVYVDSSHIACTGVGTSQTAFTGAGLASLTMLIGTSSTATPTPFTPWAEVANYTIATSSVYLMISSSTIQTATSTNAITWPAATYMTFTTNATNTAVCTVGVNTIGS